SLYSFLKSLDIDVEVDHPFFGKVKEYIKETLIKNYYLHCEFEDKTKIQIFQWGIRAEIEISKMKVIINLLMYGNKQPKDWPEHYRAAENQFREREELKEETRDESSYWAATSLWDHPVEVLAGVPDVARLTVDAVLGIDLQSLALSRIEWHKLIHTSGTITIFESIEDA
ncbi:hypothetical protein GWI33_013637, partial [Rhynchophorus ferrugineus]